MDKPDAGRSGRPPQASSAERRRCLLRFTAPRYWPTWLLLAWLRLAALAPIRVTLGIHKAFGRVAGAVLAPRARVARRNLQLCFPELCDAQIESLLRRHFEALGACIGETAIAWFAPRRKLLRGLEVEGREHLDAALATGRGVLLFTGHFTALEVTGPLLATLVPRFTFMYSRRSNALLDEIQARGRERSARASMPKEDVRGLLSCLRQNGVVWYAADQFHGGRHGRLVRFFGEPAMTNAAITRIARLSGAAVVPFFYRRRRRDNAWVLTFEAPLDAFPSEHPESDLRRLLAALEQAIRRAPEQYMWSHKRFRDRPPPLPDVYRKPPAAPEGRPPPAQRAGPLRAARSMPAAGARRLGAPVVGAVGGLVRGLWIGTAQLVPGMSGGSAALMLGVYQRLLRAIARLDGEWLNLLLQRRFGDAMRRMDILFVAPIALGMLSAPLIFSRAVPLQVLIAEMPEMTYGLIFGLIAASIVSLLIGVGERRLVPYGWLVAGVAVGCSAVIFVPQTPPDSLWLVFLCGSLIVVAMLMPGLSGALVLLVLGMHADAVDALSRLDAAFLLPLAAGALAGAVLFSRLMTWLLERYREQTMLAMVGVLGGSLLALWPFREWNYAEIDGRVSLTGAAPYIPQTLDRGVLMGAGMMLVGVLVFSLLERTVRRASGRPRG